MCIICKGRFEKSTLNRHFDEEKQGRGFYICNSCLGDKFEILRKKLTKFKIFKNLDENKLKEKLLNGR